MPRPIPVAITFDDLPCHGPLTPGETRLSIIRQIIAVLQGHHVPPVYGFMNGECVTDDPPQKAVLQAWLDAGNNFGQPYLPAP